MLKALRFVQGAVAKRDFHPVLTHYRIRDGFVQGYNGELALCSPIPLDIEATPHAVDFLRALRACDETVAIHKTPTGRLSIKSGNFKTLVNCTDVTFPEVEPKGQEVNLGGSILPVFRRLLPLTAEDASRSWAQGILLRGASAYATNNIVLVEHWTGNPLPIEINIPKMAIAEILRIGEEPSHMQVDESSCTFHFSGGRWLRTLTYNTSWPNLSKVLDNESNQQPIPDGLFDTFEKLLPFLGDNEAVYIHKGLLSTGLDPESTQRLNYLMFNQAEHLPTTPTTSCC